MVITSDMFSSLLRQLLWTALFPPPIPYPPTNPYIEVLTPNMTVFEGKAFKEVIKVIKVEL